MTVLRMLAMAATVVALAAFGAAVGDFASDPSPLGALGLLVLVALMGLALARLYGPHGVTPVRRGARAERTEPPPEPAPAPEEAAAGARRRGSREPSARRRQRASVLEEAWDVPAAERRERRPRRRARRTAGTRVDINRAPAEELATLPGVGPASAAQIVAEREANGPYATVSDLARVDGFSPERVRRLADRATA